MSIPTESLRLPSGSLPQTGLSFAEWQPEVHPNLGNITEYMQGISRRTGIALDELKKPESLILLAAVGIVVGGTLFNEINLLNKGPFDVHFAFSYAKENVLPSFLWTSPPSELISMAAGRGADMLRNFDPAYIATLPPQEAREMANLALRFHGSQYLRWATVGVVALSQIVNMMNIGQRANETFRTNISSGKESLFSWWEKLSGQGSETIIRLAGQQSDVTEYDLANNYHIFPIYENPELITTLVRQVSQNYSRPVYWQVDTKKYGDPSSWNGLHITKENLVKARRGKKEYNVLILEADASVGEQALALAPESANDLDLQEVSQGFRMIEQLADRNKIHIDKTFRVLLTDPNQVVGSGEEGPYTLREQNEALHHADILIDAKNSLISEVAMWLQKTTPADSKTVIFQTSNDDYFKTISKVLSKLGYKVKKWSPNSPTSPNTPHLIYLDTTADTIETTRTLIRTGKVSSENCCPLLDRINGLEKLDELKRELEGEKGQSLSGICSAKIYSDLFRLVRS